ncbi:MAG: signal peptidase I [Sciscionella sp.]
MTSTILALCVTAALGLAGALAVVPAVFGGHTLTVLSASMSPAIPVSSVVVVLAVRPESVSVGEVVTYATTNPVSGANELVTHRVTGIGEVGAEPVFTTKGDANRVTDDRAVDASQLRGRVWYHVPWVGIMRDSVFTRTGAMYAAAAALLIVGLGLLRGIGRSASVARDRTERPGE